MREKLAALCHEQWSGWMKYLFSRCKLEAIGTWHNEKYVHVITSCDYERWKRQMQTPYAELSEKEKESDRKEADKFLELLNELRKKSEIDFDKTPRFDGI